MGKEGRPRRAPLHNILKWLTIVGTAIVVCAVAVPQALVIVPFAAVVFKAISHDEHKLGKDELMMIALP